MSPDLRASRGQGLSLFDVCISSAKHRECSVKVCCSPHWEVDVLLLSLKTINGTSDFPTEDREEVCKSEL